MSPRRLLDPRNGDRLIAVVFSVWFAYAAVWLLLLQYDKTEQAANFYPWLWPWVFAAAALLGFAYASRPTSIKLFAWSGGLMIASLLSRGMSLIVSFVTGKSILSTPRVFLSAGAWLMLAYSVGTLWSRFLRRYGEVRRRRVR